MRRTLLYLALPAICSIIAKGEIRFDDGLQCCIKTTGLGALELHTSYSMQYINGDTIINGILAKKAYESGVKRRVSHMEPTCFLNCQGPKIYYAKPSAEIRWLLLFDYSLAIGEECTVYSGVHYCPYNVKCVERIENYNGTGLKALKIICPEIDPRSHNIWIEGIGSDIGLFDSCDIAVDGVRSRAIYTTKDSNVLFYSPNCSLINKAEWQQAHQENRH